MPEKRNAGDRLNNPHHHSRSISMADFRPSELSARGSRPTGDEDADGFGHAPAYGEPSLEFPEYSHEAKRPYKTQRTIEAERFGYRLPEEQTSYEGASARMLDRHFEEHES